jgi:hypothetical protein
MKTYAMPFNTVQDFTCKSPVMLDGDGRRAYVAVEVATGDGEIEDQQLIVSNAPIATLSAIQSGTIIRVETYPIHAALQTFTILSQPV